MVMEPYLSPRDTGKFVSAKAKHVTIDDPAIERLAELMANAAEQGKLSHDSFKYTSLFPNDEGLSLEQLMNWTFMIDAINFNFWTKNSEPKFKVSHGNVTRAGYLGMVTAVNRALAEKKPMCDPKYYGALSLDELKHIFRSNTASLLPLFPERAKVLKDVAEKLLEKYDGCFSKVVAEAEGDALKLVDIVVREFECFRDFARYEGKLVSLLKRAQIVAADIDLLLRMKDQPGLKNMDELTMFADYRVPQVLLYYGVLKYSDTLREKVKKEYLFENGSAEEVEIRACSIEAVERLVSSTRKVLENRGKTPQQAQETVNSAKLDYLLWDFRVQNAKDLIHVPYHRTRCIYY